MPALYGKLVSKRLSYFVSNALRTDDKSFLHNKISPLFSSLSLSGSSPLSLSLSHFSSLSFPPCPPTSHLLSSLPCIIVELTEGAYIYECQKARIKQTKIIKESEQVGEDRIEGKGGVREGEEEGGGEGRRGKEEKEETKEGYGEWGERGSRRAK